MTQMVHGTSHTQMGEPVLSRWWRTVDRWTISCVLLLVAVGLLLALASSPPLAQRTHAAPFFYFQKHAVYVALSMSVMFFLSIAGPESIRRWGVIGFGLGVAALMAVLVVGTDLGKGATRWLDLGPTTIQPAEFVKPCLIVASAWLLAAGQDLNAPPGRLLSLVAVLSVVGLLVLQPDFGQSVLILFAWGVMYFVSGAPMLIILGLAGLAVLAGFGAYNFSEHFARRIDGYLTTEIDARSQLGYATSAIQEGGLFGMGVGEGQVKWDLPDAHTDFVIAVAAEEYGFVLVAFIIILYATICLRSLSRLMRERDPFIRLAGTGLIALLSAQAMINMGVAVRLLPAKGMTLPFISQGGSSLVAIGLTVGMLLALTRTRPQGEIGDLLLNRGR